MSQADPYIALNVLAFAGIAALLFRLRGPRFSLAQRILAGLVSGVLYALALKLAYGDMPAVIDGTLAWTNVVGQGYINLLLMIVMPLVLVMMIAAVVRMRELATLGKIGGTVIAILIGMTMVAALTGVAVVSLFGLTAEGLTEGARELARVEALAARQESLAGLSLPDMLVRFIPSNVFDASGSAVASGTGICAC